MNSIASFFAGIMTFVSSLFGHPVTQQEITTSSGAPILVVSNIQEAKQSLTINSTTSQLSGTFLIEDLQWLLYSCKSKDDWKKKQCGMTTEALYAMDASTLKKIENTYYVDKNNVYIAIDGVETSYITILKNANPTTFEVLKNKYYLSKDKNSVFIGENKVDGIDTMSFHLISTSSQEYAVNTSTVYSIELPERHGGLITLKKINGADPKTFILPDKPIKLKEVVAKGQYQYGYSSDYKYYKDDKNVYIKMYENEIKAIEGADLETFSLDIPSASTSSYNYYLEFSKDKNHIYFRGKATPFSQNFILISPGSRKDCGGGAYVTDIQKGKRVIFIPDYHYQKKETDALPFVEIQNADLGTFTVFTAYYSKDKNHVYRGTSTTKDNPEKFNLDDVYRKCTEG